MLLLALAGCREPAEPPPALVPLFHVDTNSSGFIDDARAALEEAGITARFRAMSEFGPGERPAFVADEDSGWVLFVRAEQKDDAMAAYGEWLAGLKAYEPPPEPEPVTLGRAGPLAPERVEDIRAELTKRVRVDQEVRRDRRRHDEMQGVDADNTAWLRTLVIEVGWIDAERFGREAAGAAFLLVQHSGDLPLMTAALPEIEKDVRAGRLDGQPYALLYDRLHFMRGGKQRYGTQVVVREGGEQVVERLEDPDNVDARRREIGLGALADYLAGFDGKVKIER
jgi:hypothetical protein